MLTTIALFASSRRHGHTGQLLDCIAQRLGVEVIDDQLIFSSPVYWYAVSPQMKTFLDGCPTIS
jgi:hypothetical protein